MVDSAFALLNRLTADLMPGTSFTDAGQDVRNGMERAMDSAMLDVGLAAAALRGVVMNSSSKTVTKTGYDDSGNLTDIHYNDGTAQHWDYDPVWGQVTKYIDQEGRTTKQQLDPVSGRVLSVTQIIGEDDDTSAETDDLTTSFTYTDGSGALPEGLLLTVTDPEGNVTLVGYDTDPESASFGLATSITYASGTADESTIYFDYDNDGNVDSLTDAVGNETTWVLDEEGRVTVESIVLNQQTVSREYVYDEEGRLWIYIDRNGRATEYVYYDSGDAEGYVRYEKWYAEGDDPRDEPAPTPVRVIEYGYTFDAAGSLVEFTVDDADVDFTYTFDAAGNLTETEWDFAAISGASDVVFAYGYARGDLTSTEVTLLGTADYRNDYAYDDFGRLTQVTQQSVSGGNAVAEKRVDFTYTDAGFLESIARFSDLDGLDLVASTVYSYNADLVQLTGLIHSINNTNEDTVEYSYTYEDDGQINTIDSSEDGVFDYDYDAQGQLTDISIDQNDAEHYEYDANGNRTSTGLTGSEVTYATSAYNRLESVDDGTDVWAYGYDAEGNLVIKFLDADESESLNTGDTQITEYAWDHRNRLVAVTSYDTFSDYQVTSSQEVEYAYDFLNRLVIRTIDEDGSGATYSPESEYFVHDGDSLTNTSTLLDLATNPDGEKPFGPDPSTDAGQIVLQLDESGNPTHRYLWGPAVDQILADEVVDGTPGDPEDVHWPLTDHQHTVRDILAYDDVTDDWLIANHLTYDAYGNTLSQTDAAITCLFHYTGRLYDEATGLQNNLNRWYDPEIGRWVSDDPIGINSGDVNFYRYCGNDPVNWIDPSGLFWGEVWGGIKGLGQGACNIGNGLQDTVIGIANLPATAVNGIAWAEEKVGILPEGSIRAPYIPSPDWSKDLVTHEGGTGWANSHEWSKGLGAGGVEILTGAAISKVSKARQAAGAIEEVTEQVAKKATREVAEEVAEQAAKKTSTALVPKSTVELGKWGEARLAADLGYQGVKPASAFKTSLGKRFFDRLLNGVAHEAKAGVNVGLTSNIRTQVLKDAELIAKDKIRGAVWHFYQGAQQELLDFLTQHGIQYVVH